MSSKRKLKKYIGPGYYRIVAWVLGITSVGLMIFGLSRIFFDLISEFLHMALLSIFLSIFWIGFVIGNIIINRYSRRSFSRLETIGLLDRAAQELDNPLAIYGKDRCRISENFVYAGRYGAALYLGDVIWVYKQEAEFSDGSGNSFLKARICTGQKFTIICFNGFNGADERDLIMTKLCERNPYILTGSSKDNRNKCKEAIKIYQTTRRRPFEIGRDSPAGE